MGAKSSLTWQGKLPHRPILESCIFSTLDCLGVQVQLNSYGLQSLRREVKHCRAFEDMRDITNDTLIIFT
jgi:hypothetical protein